MSLLKKVDDFLAAWKYESDSTIKMFTNLTDESLNQKVTEDGRSLGFIAWHITLTIGEMMSKTGLSFNDFDEHAPLPAFADVILTTYKKHSSEMSSQIMNNWNDNMLEDSLNMYGQTWKRGDVLVSLLSHQSHHRGQMTVLMRQAGLKVPGVYGPSKEEWSEFGMATLP